jgi:hypothetical protein
MVSRGGIIEGVMDLNSPLYGEKIRDTPKSGYHTLRSGVSLGFIMENCDFGFSFDFLSWLNSVIQHYTSFCPRL